MKHWKLISGDHHFLSFVIILLYECVFHWNICLTDRKRGNNERCFSSVSSSCGVWSFMFGYSDVTYGNCVVRCFVYTRVNMWRQWADIYMKFASLLVFNCDSRYPRIFRISTSFFPNPCVHFLIKIFERKGNHTYSCLFSSYTNDENPHKAYTHISLAWQPHQRKLYKLIVVAGTTKPQLHAHIYIYTHVHSHT
jgi:hypothetical protein